LSDILQSLLFSILMRSFQFYYGAPNHAIIALFCFTVNKKQPPLSFLIFKGKREERPYPISDQVTAMLTDEWYFMQSMSAPWTVCPMKFTK